MNLVAPLVAAFISINAPILAQGTASPYHESPYAGDLLSESQGQDHFVVIEHKCGSGCEDCALLFISYETVKLIHSSMFAVIQSKLHLGKENHAGVEFDRWDIVNGKLYLKAYIEYPEKTLNKKVIYDLRTESITVL